MKIKVLIPDKIDEKAIEILKENGLEVEYRPGIKDEELLKICSEYDAMIVRSGVKITKEVIDAAKNLKIVVRAGVGVDTIDILAASEKGIVVENTPLGNINAAAEHTLAFLMLLSKHIVNPSTEMKKGIWDRKKYEASELKGKTLGIIGMGNVGKKVGKVASSLEMDVVGFDPFINSPTMEQSNVRKVDFDELLKLSDYVTVHVPLNDKTANLIDMKEFELMKDGVKILNVARGGVINEDALYHAIVNGKVERAALDVFEKEPPVFSSLIAHEKVICTPHLGASTKEAQINVAVDAANQVAAALKHGKIINCLNNILELKQ